MPDLFSYIQTRVDATKKTGEFALTGSQNFLLLDKVSQSLAGRTCIIHLLPFSCEEIGTNFDLYTLMHQGFYPKLYDVKMDAYQWHKSYVNTYIERDIRSIKNIQTFIQLCAGRIGQLLNIHSLSNDASIDVNTAKSWLSILEASFIVFLLKPYHNNFNKRLVKSPKLYFYDTGLACYLLGIEKPDDLFKHFARGAIFENFILSELIKHRFNEGKNHNLFFWRDSHGHEVDILFAKGQEILPIEVKSSATMQKSFFDELRYFQMVPGAKQGYLIYAGDTEKPYDLISTLGWKRLPVKELV